MLDTSFCLLYDRFSGNKRQFSVSCSFRSSVVHTLFDVFFFEIIHLKLECLLHLTYGVVVVSEFLIQVFWQCCMYFKTSPFEFDQLRHFSVETLSWFFVAGASFGVFFCALGCFGQWVFVAKMITNRESVVIHVVWVKYSPFKLLPLIFLFT